MKGTLQLDSQRAMTRPATLLHPREAGQANKLKSCHICLLSVDLADA
jgi:hypothetical protein